MSDISKKLTEERGKNYGHPLDNFTRMAAMAEIIADCPDDAVRQALYMIGMKVTRLIESPDHQDSIDDIKGYAETINMIWAERSRRSLNTLDHPEEFRPAYEPAWPTTGVLKP